MTTATLDPLTAVGTTHRRAVSAILRTWDRADAITRDDGARWYGHAFDIAAEIAEAGNIDVVRAAVVIAHLSPRTSWKRNVIGARALVATGHAPACIGANVERARAALIASDPWSTFGQAPKTRAFAANILGDTDAVTVDVWAARVASVDDTKLSRSGIYDALARAYRVAARRAGVTAPAMQATTWLVIRNVREVAA